MTAGYLLDIGLILFSTKLLGIFTRRFYMPQVVGALLAGLILGPGMLNLIGQSDFLVQTAEIGVIVLMFCAGMETDVHELKKAGMASFIIALIGVLVPLAGGFLVAFFFNRRGIIASDVQCSLFLQNIFIGVILTATSVSITVETLKEIGKLNTHSGNTILGAAVIDDVLGIIALTIISSMADESVKISMTFLKIIGYFVFVMIVIFLFRKLFDLWCSKSDVGLRRYSIIALTFCVLMAYVSEEYFGVADITGAYIAGVGVSMTKKEDYIASRINILSYLYLSPVFFASIGLKVTLPEMNMNILWFAVILTVVAILTKVIGCGLGAKLCKYSDLQSLRIGVGMISRGEVALIVASKGTALGLMGRQLMGPIIIVVIITTIAAPILLKFVYQKEGED